MKSTRIFILLLIIFIVNIQCISKRIIKPTDTHYSTYTIGEITDNRFFFVLDSVMSRLGESARSDVFCNIGVRRYNVKKVGDIIYQIDIDLEYEKDTLTYDRVKLSVSLNTAPLIGDGVVVFYNNRKFVVSNLLQNIVFKKTLKKRTFSYKFNMLKVECDLPEIRFKYIRGKEPDFLYSAKDYKCIRWDWKEVSVGVMNCGVIDLYNLKEENDSIY